MSGTPFGALLRATAALRVITAGKQEIDPANGKTRRLEGGSTLIGLIVGFPEGDALIPTCAHLLFSDLLTGHQADQRVAMRRVQAAMAGLLGKWARCLGTCRVRAIKAGSSGLEAAVVVAVCSMRMMQVPFYQVIGVVSVQHGLVAAIRTMSVI